MKSVKLKIYLDLECQQHEVQTFKIVVLEQRVRLYKYFHMVLKNVSHERNTGSCTTMPVNEAIPYSNSLPIVASSPSFPRTLFYMDSLILWRFCECLPNWVRR